MALSIPELPVPLTIIDSVQENGPKLVEAPESAPLAVQAAPIGFRLAPLREYRIALVASFAPTPAPGASAAAAVAISVVDAVSGAPIAGANVTAFTDFAKNEGAASATDSSGTARLALGNPPVAVERLYISPPRNGYWGHYATSLRISPGDQFSLRRIDLTAGDVVRQMYAAAAPTDGAGVKVGVIDTGIDLHHPDLAVASGRNTAHGESAAHYGDNGLGHGTHVAGIIASRGSLPAGITGLAPGVTLSSYRVFAANQQTTTNYEILKAMILAVNDGCDILNLSLGGVPADDVMRDAIQDAADQGVLVVAAAGNDNRQAVNFPAAYAPGLAVTAFGKIGSFPAGTYDDCYVCATPASTTDPGLFIAAFSNIGPEVFFAAPGVGVISTISGGGYGAMSGTSMATPVVTGIAARTLARSAAIQSMNRDTFRTRALTNALSASALNLGFPFNYQGFGRPA